MSTEPVNQGGTLSPPPSPKNQPPAQTGVSSKLGTQILGQSQKLQEAAAFEKRKIEPAENFTEQVRQVCLKILTFLGLYHLASVELRQNKPEWIAAEKSIRDLLMAGRKAAEKGDLSQACLLYTSPSPRD